MARLILQKEKRSESKESSISEVQTIAVPEVQSKLAKPFSFKQSSPARTKTDQTDVSKKDAKQSKKQRGDRNEEQNGSKNNGKYAKQSSNTKTGHPAKSYSKVPFYKRPYCIPLLLAVMMIFAGIYISIFAEHEQV